MSWIHSTASRQALPNSVKDRFLAGANVRSWRKADTPPHSKLLVGPLVRRALRNSFPSAIWVLLPPPPEPLLKSQRANRLEMALCRWLTELSTPDREDTFCHRYRWHRRAE